MLYLDYAKQTENGYIMNFFANSVEDLEDISEGKEFVTKNGTNYGVPAPQSVVTITNKDGEKTTYLMGEDGNWIPGVVNPTDYYTKKQADEKFADKGEVAELSQTALTSNNVKTLFGNQSIVGTGNIDLYRHNLFISQGESGSYIKAYTTVYSSSNLKVDSLTDLKTILDLDKYKTVQASGYLLNYGGRTGTAPVIGIRRVGDQTYDYVCFTDEGDYTITIGTDNPTFSDTVTTI